MTVDTALLAMAIAGLGWASDPQVGKREMQRACVPCHSLRLLESQRLSPAAWGKELDKMERWGAPIKDRQALLDYLAQEYPVTKPEQAPEHTGDGTKGSTQAH